MLSLQDNACLLLDFPFHHVTVHALSFVVVVEQGLVQPMPDLAWDHRGCDQLGMRMLLTSAGIGPVVLENCDVVNAVVHAQEVVALPVDTENVGHLRLGLQGHGAGMVGALDDDFVNSKALDTPPYVLHISGGLRSTG